MGYASEYYDPAKAHEYYLKHRQLKGNSSRKSTKGLNEAGKIAAKEVKERIMEERKAALKQVTEATKAKIQSMRAQLKGMSKLQKQFAKGELQQQIEQIRADAKQQKTEVKAKYEEKYLAELDKIKADQSMRKGKKSKKK